jgi:hypothetical protein
VSAGDIVETSRHTPQSPRLEQALENHTNGMRRSQIQEVCSREDSASAELFGPAEYLLLERHALILSVSVIKTTTYL